MRTHILCHAQLLFADHGPGDVTMDEVAAVAGITTRQLRVYFTSPTALYRATHTPGSTPAVESVRVTATRSRGLCALP